MDREARVAVALTCTLLACAVAGYVGLVALPGRAQAQPYAPLAGSPAPSPQPTGPATVALRPVQVVTSCTTALAYRVNDAAAPQATVTIVVTDATGAVAAGIPVTAAVPTNAVLTYVFRCALAPGLYHYHVEAVDSLGQGQVSASAAPLRVLPIFPLRGSINAASRWLRQRHSTVGFAVIDDRGVLRGYHLNGQFASASVVKAMLLVRYLRSHRTIRRSTKAELARMIIVSDNAAASAIYRIVGDRGLRAVAHLVGMTHFAVHGDWALAQISAADQARLFYRMDSYVPKRYDAWVRYLFSHITPAHCWGIPEIARPAGWRVFFKGGYMPVGAGIVVHEASRLERRHVAFALVVLTAGRESLAYGAATLRGTTARVIGVDPRAAVVGMIPNLRFAP
jgi:hypothetical protein